MHSFPSLTISVSFLQRKQYENKMKRSEQTTTGWLVLYKSFILYLPLHPLILMHIYLPVQQVRKNENTHGIHSKSRSPTVADIERLPAFNHCFVDYRWMRKQTRTTNHLLLNLIFNFISFHTSKEEIDENFWTWNKNDILFWIQTNAFFCFLAIEIVFVSFILEPFDFSAHWAPFCLILTANPIRNMYDHVWPCIVQYVLFIFIMSCKFSIENRIFSPNKYN